MKIEVGKTYRTRGGLKVRVLLNDGSSVPWKVDQVGATWRNTDGSWHGDGQEHEYDLVAEWSDSTEKPARALGEQVGGDHYRSMKIQPIEYIHANGMGFAAGNVVKYVSRYQSKNGIEDLKKARHFLDLLIELESRGDSDE